MPDDDLPNITPIQRGGEPTRGGRSEAAARRQAQALEMRLAGATFSQIAQAVGYGNAGTAHTAVKRALERDYDARINPELREKYRQLNVARCERLVRAYWMKAVQGDVLAADRVLKMMEREARLLGLDPPQQVVVTEITRSSLLAMLDDVERTVIDADVVELEMPELPPASNGHAVNGD